MKYEVGQKVKIKSLDWYNKNKDYNDGAVYFRKAITFVESMSKYCGQVATIIKVTGGIEYKIDLDNGYYSWTDEMIEGLAEEETKPNIIEEAKTYWDSIKDAWICPEGYIFKDENGNVINAMKIVLEKKKKEYPKTYEECCKVLGYDDRETYCVCHTGANERLFERLYSLKVCRDAYWKIAGEEMGLGKPWEPTKDEMVYSIYRHSNKIGTEMFLGKSVTFEFPTPEMRDTFKKNFDPDIEICKEFL